MNTILIYESAGCSSCRKAKAWLEEKGLNYKTVNIFSKALTSKELKYLFSMSSDIYEVLSKRSTAVQNFKRIHGFEIEELSFNKLLDFIQKNPSALKRPLITNGKILVSGYDEDEITALLPRHMRSCYPGRVIL